MKIKLIWPEKEQGTLVKKEICIETNRFDMVNMLDNISDPAKMKGILKGFDGSYNEIEPTVKVDIIKDLYSSYSAKPKKSRRIFEEEEY